MTKIIAAVVTCVVLVVAFTHGCGARVEVAKDKFLKRIDSMLGSLDVQRKQIEIGVTGLKEGIDTLRRAKIKAQVCGDQIQRQAKPVEEKAARMDSALKTLRAHLEANKPVEIAGTKYSPEQLKDLAGRVLAERKACEVQLDGFQQSQSRLTKVIATLEGKLREAEKRLADIESEVALIDSNRIALTAMKRSAEAMGGVDEGLTKNLDQLQDKVANLHADVEAELRAEDERWGDTATKEVDSVESFVAKLQTSGDMTSEIDHLNSGSKR
jgi:phage shock protein A